MYGWFLLLLYFITISVVNANSVNPDQTPQKAASDLGLHCLHLSLLGDARLKWVKDLGWETPESRRKKDRLTTLYKIQHGSVSMDTGHNLRLNDRRTKGKQRLYQPTVTVSVYKNSFPRTIQDWNLLPAGVTDYQTIEEFR